MLYAPLDSNHIPLVSPGAGLLDFLIKSKVIAVGFFFFPFSVTKRSEKSNQTFFFFFSQSDFLLFFQQLNANALQLKPVRLHHRQTDSLTASSGHTRCCRCSWRVNAPPLSLHTLRDASRCCCGSRVCGAQVRRRTHTGRQEEMERLSKQQIMSSSS